MWVYQPNINIHTFINNNDFDLIHYITDGWRNEDDSSQILFEHSGAWYIVAITSVDTGFNNDFTQSISFPSPVGTINAKAVKSGGSWIFYRPLVAENAVWKGIPQLNNSSEIDTSSLATGHYILSGSDLVPYNVNQDSMDLYDYEVVYTRTGENVYKSATQFGSYVWQGVGTVDDIIVGWRYYTHKATDDNGNIINEDVDVYESVELTEVSENEWRYTYKGDLYSYTGQLPLSSFTMTSGELEIDMTFKELVALNKDKSFFDGGTQNVG